MGERVPVVLSADRNFALQLATTLASLDAVTSGPDVQRVYVLADGYDAELERRVAAGRSEWIRLTWVDVADRLVDDLPTNFHISRASYTRLFLASLLPPELDRVLYLDCDLLLCRPITELAGADLHGHTIGAVVDFSAPRIALPDALLGWRSLGLDGRLPYFNAGVLVIDLARWRALGLEQRLRDHVRDHRELLRWHDQDALNACAAGDIEELAPIWNVQVMRRLGRYSGPAFALYPRAVLEDAFDRPAIAHFGGYDKPWHATMPSSPLVDEWRRLAGTTALSELLDVESVKAKLRLRTRLVRRRVRTAARVVRRGE